MADARFGRIQCWVGLSIAVTLVACAGQGSGSAVQPAAPAANLPDAAEPGALPADATVVDAAVPVAPQLAKALPYARGGSRLAAQYFVAPGAEQFRGLFDRRSQASCEFVHGEVDADYRCVPTAQLQDVLYLDAQCREPVAPTEARVLVQDLEAGWRSTPARAEGCAGDLPAYRAVYSFGARVFEGGVGVMPPPLWRHTAAGCEVGSLTFGHVVPGLQRIMPLAAANLVSARLRSIDVGGGLFVRRLFADDGTQVTVGVAAADSKVCAVQSNGRCVPLPLLQIDAADQGVFQDASCQQRGWLSATGPGCTRERYGVRRVDQTVQVFQLQPMTRGYTLQPVWDFTQQPPVMKGPTCQLIDWSAVVFGLGSEIADGFPRGRQVVTGSGELTQLRWVGADSRDDARLELEPGADFVDRKHRACRVEAVVDGSYRCLPLAAAVHELDAFANPGCTQRLYAPEDPDAAPDQLRLVEFDAQQRLTRLSALEAHHGASYQVVQTVCQQVSARDNPGWVVDHDVGFDTLPAVTASEL